MMDIKRDLRLTDTRPTLSCYSVRLIASRLEATSLGVKDSAAEMLPTQIGSAQLKISNMGQDQRVSGQDTLSVN